MRLKKRKVLITEKLTVRNRKTGQTKQLDRVVTKSPPETPPGYVTALIRYVPSVKLSLDFNSVGVEVGVEMPMPVRPGNITDLRRAVATVEELVESRLEKKAGELKTVLLKMKKQHG